MRVGGGSLPTTPNTLKVGPGGKLTGKGAVLGNVIIDGGRVAPGNSPGALQVNGDFTLDSSSVLELEIAGLTVGVQYDQLLVSGALNLGGTVQFSFLDGFQPAPGDQFDLFHYGGVFDATGLNIDAPAGYGFSNTSGNGTVSFRVTQVPEPTSLGLLILGACGWVLGRRRKIGSVATSFVLLALCSTGLKASTVTESGTDATPAFGITPTPDLISAAADVSGALVHLSLRVVPGSIPTPKPAPSQMPRPLQQERILHGMKASPMMPSVWGSSIKSFPVWSFIRFRWMGKSPVLQPCMMQPSQAE